MAQPAAKFYDAAWSERWIDCVRLGPSLRHRRRLILRLVCGLEIGSVLDVGCGDGANLAGFLAARPVPVVAGVDISPAAVRLAQARLPQGNFRVLDLAAGHLDRKFDLVLCCDVLEHIEDDVAVLRNLRAMTGRCLVATTLQGRMRPWERDIGHVRNYTRAGLEERIRQAGFVPERTLEWGFPFFSPVHRALLERAGPGVSEGHFGPVRRTVAALLYLLFFANSKRRGDVLITLARPAP